MSLSANPQQTLRNESDAHYAALEHEREEAREQIRTMRVQLKEATMEVRQAELPIHCLRYH